MDIDGQRRSNNFEDRGRGSGGGRRGGGIPIQAVASLMRFLGFKGTLILGGLVAVGYVALPAGVRQQLLQAIGGGGPGDSPRPGAGKVCAASPANAQACDFLRAILASTEDTWVAPFQQGALPRYRGRPGPYQQPTLVVFAQGVSTGCGNASSAIGPFYCPADRRLYIDPSFYETLARRLKAPGDFAQAYVIAHEVGHHVQTLIGAPRDAGRGETKNQGSVRYELQADCLAGVWGHAARASLAVTDEDLAEAVNAAHAIGDDALGHARTDDYTHGSSAQRMRWFRRGFQTGDARQCDTFAVARFAEL